MFIISLDKRKKIPYYKQIMSSIKERINSNLVKDGTRMPTMEDVANYFHISVIAVTQAYDMLAKEGYLIKVKGKGTFVKHRPNMLVSLKDFYNIDYYFKDTLENVKRIAHFIDASNNKTIIKFTTYIKNYPTYHQEVTYFKELTVDIQDILNQPLSLFNVLLKLHPYEKLTYESFFQTKNADLQDAILLDIKEKDPLFYIITNISYHDHVEAIVKTYYPSEFVTFEVES
jgi:DNA-binding GntR family transcriptional regulator